MNESASGELGFGQLAGECAEHHRPRHSALSTLGIRAAPPLYHETGEHLCTLGEGPGGKHYRRGDPAPPALTSAAAATTIRSG